MRKLLGLLCVFLVAQACSTSRPAGTSAAATLSGCTDVKDPDGPVVCVDDAVNPPVLGGYGKTVNVHSKLLGGGYVYVTWKTIGGADLDLKMENSNTGQKCYKPRFLQRTCTGDTCRIRVNPAAAKTQCDYNLWVRGVKADPVIIVEEWPFVPDGSH